MTKINLRRPLLLHAHALLIVGFSAWLAAPAQAQTDYTTLNFGATGTFLTGIRGDNIVGNYVIEGTGETGGLLHDLTTGIWTPFPVATPNGANYPGAIGSSPYGPSFGSQFGILRAVGSYKTQTSDPDNLSYLYDGAAAPGGHLTPLAYPDNGSPTINTIAHSTFGNLVVGNYDTQLATGNAFIYDIATGAYTTNNVPGATSTTAYGVWGDKIAGGYFMNGIEHGYIYDRTTDVFTTYHHPDAVFTHFEGITGAGRGGEFSLVVDWIDIDNDLHAAVLHIGPGGAETWIEIEIPGATTVSSNSAYADKVIGVYGSGGPTNGYVATIPSIYNPIMNSADLVVDTPGVPAIVAGPGDDVVNTGTILTTGADNSGIFSSRFGVVTNIGLVEVSGLGSAAVEMQGEFGSLLNMGTLIAAPGADAIRSAQQVLGAQGFDAPQPNGVPLGATGTLVVNKGVIDGPVRIDAGPFARFENSGWLGASGAGAWTTHAVSGVFAQTAAGTLALRIGADGNDMLQIDGVARLAGTLLADFRTTDLTTSYTLLTASAGHTGIFDDLTTFGLAVFMSASLDYAPTEVTLELMAAMAQLQGLTPNQQAVGGVLDEVFNTGGGLPGGLEALFALSADQLPGALDALSGEAHASQQSALVNASFFTRQAVLDRLRQIAYSGEGGPESALAYAGTTLAYSPADPVVSAVAALPDDGLSTQAIAADPSPRSGLSFWAQAYGGWSSIDGDGNAARISSELGGVISGADTRIGEDAWAGIALGFSQSASSVGARASSTDVDTAFISLYAGTTIEGWTLRGGGVYGLNRIDSDRSIVFPGFTDRATADYDARLGQIFGEIGHGMAFRGVAIEPFAGLAWVHLDRDGFTESGGVAALIGADASSNVGYSTLGIRIATDLMLSDGSIMTPHMSLAWQHAFGDVTPAASLAFAGIAGSNFTVAGVPLASDELLLDLGAELRVSEALSFGVSYLGQFSDSARDNSVRGGVSWRF